MEIRMTGLWKGPGVLLRNLILDFLAIQQMNSALPEDWWENHITRLTPPTSPILIFHADDGSLRILSSGLARDILLAKPTGS